MPSNSHVAPLHQSLPRCPTDISSVLEGHIPMVTYQCLCCGYTRTFTGECVSLEEIAQATVAGRRIDVHRGQPETAIALGEIEAFHAGWDTPHYFTAAPLCTACLTSLFLELVPGTDLMVPTRRQHHAAHLAWAARGSHPEGGNYTEVNVTAPATDEEVGDAFTHIRLQYLARRKT